MADGNGVVVAALDLWRMGWCPIPVPAGAKKPVADRWGELRLDEDAIEATFRDGMNVGVLTGEPSGWRVDVDLDCPEAVALAPSFLPPTRCVHGRPGNPRSHLWYTAEGAEFEQFEEPAAPGEKRGAMLVEIRSSVPGAHQTIVPPSLHPAGERYRWEERGEAPRVLATELRQDVARLAAAALTARAWPAEGSRDLAALALAGVLCRAGWVAEDVDRFVVAAAKAAGDEESSSRAKAVRTYADLKKGSRVFGFPKLQELLGAKVAARIVEWLGVNVGRVESLAPEIPLPSGLISAAQLLDTTYPPLAFVCAPYFPRAELVEIVGPHGSFKSMLALDLALAVASGRTWGGAPVFPGRAAFITLEDREAVLAQRVACYLAGIEDADERAAARELVRERLAFLAREQATGLALTLTDRTGTYLRPEAVDRVVELVAARDLVILETASRLHPGPETNEGLAVFASAVERIATTSGAACGVVRHVPKDTARNTDKDPDSYWGRGGGSFSDAARSVLAVKVDAKGKDEQPDPLAAVRVFHVKPPPFSRRGDPLAWKPTRIDPNQPDGPIYLRPMSNAEELWNAANRLHLHLRELGAEGLTKTEIHNAPPCGLSRVLARQAMEKLITDRRATVRTERRGTTKQEAVVFRAVGATE